MKSYLLFTLIMVIGIHTCFNKSAKAQQNISADTLEVADFKPHSLQFQVNGLEDITSFQGGVVSYKYQLNSKNAIRVGIDLYGAMDDIEEERDEFGNDTTLLGGQVDRKGISIDTLDANQSISDDHFSIGINTQFIRYFNPYEDIKVFGGIGPALSYSKQEIDISTNIKEKFLDIDQDTSGTSRSREILRDLERENTRSTEGFEAGLSAVLGVEWFVHENISLTAEYGLSMLYQYTEREEVQDIKIVEREFNRQDVIEKSHEFQNSSTEEDSWLINDEGVKVGITVYFNL